MKTLYLYQTKLPIIAYRMTPEKGSLLETAHRISDDGYKFLEGEFKRFQQIQDYLLNLKLSHIPEREQKQND